VAPGIIFGDRIGPSLSWEIDGAAEEARRLSELADRAENPRPAMLLIKSLLEEGHRKQFASKGGFLGTPWAENSPETLARKAREGVPSLSSQMVASGDLQESLSGGKGSRSRVSKSGVSVGTSLFYAVFHINPKRKGMPARPVVGINKATEESALTILEQHVLGRP
jgi:Phage virion morphogenesis family